MDPLSQRCGGRLSDDSGRKVHQVGRGPAHAPALTMPMRTRGILAPMRATASRNVRHLGFISFREEGARDTSIVKGM